VGPSVWCLFCESQSEFQTTGEAEMAILILEVLGSWSLLAVVAGLGLGAAIARGERVRRDEFLSYVFASLETLPAYRS
jgi:hypothetical protein